MVTRCLPVTRRCGCRWEADNELKGIWRGGGPCSPGRGRRAGSRPIHVELSGGDRHPAAGAEPRDAEARADTHQAQYFRAAVCRVAAGFEPVLSRQDEGLPIGPSARGFRPQRIDGAY
jgi:hypothetical protein